VTSTSVTVGTISTQTGTLASNFSSLIYGERAYFNYVNNTLHGVNGRKINYKYALDDGGNPTTFNQLANTLINQDHVFAVTGVATAFFSPNLFVESGIPTYGYNVTGNWQGPSNLFAAGGSVQYYPAAAPQVAYVARATQKKPSIAFIAYGVAASAASCQSEQNSLKANGYTISYSDLKVNYPGSTVATDVQRMKQAGSNMVVSCMDVQGNVTMARAIKQYGLNMTQLWFSGNDQSTLNTNQSLMQNVYFDIAHVPFTASPTLYPGLKLYFAQMKKYEPAYTNDEIALQGWESAALFVQGLKLAGKNPTQASVIAADNSLTSFTSGGLTAPVNWKNAGHKGNAPPYCLAYIKVVGDKYLPTLDKGKNVFNCFQSTNPKKNPVFPLPPGTPAPA
jgi:ABC-type branched-subunit amino acid transport system substrate-binding protein